MDKVRNDSILPISDGVILCVNTVNVRNPKPEEIIDDSTYIPLFLTNTDFLIMDKTLNMRAN